MEISKENSQIYRELIHLRLWFQWYDIQTIQYNRDLRIYGKSSIDINSLDNEAIKNASRVKEIEEIIKNDEINKNNNVEC